MRGSWLVRTVIYVAAFIVIFAFTYKIASAVTLCQIGNGCTGTSTSPAYGNILIGGKSGEYEFVASSTLGSVAPVQSVFGRTGAVTGQMAIIRPAR